MWLAINKLQFPEVGKAGMLLKTNELLKNQAKLKGYLFSMDYNNSLGIRC